MFNRMPTLVWLAGAAFTVGALAATPNDSTAGQAGTAVTVTENSPAPPASGQTPATPPPAQANPRVTVLRTVDTELGAVVVDGKGRALYMSSADNNDPPTSTCYGRCAKLWVPLRVRGQVIAEGVDSDLVGVLPREDGILQVTLNDWPLYWFTRDKAPGDVNGEGYRNSWSAVGPDGKPAAR
jgi:predicted lipoprotein with Yx(FWY)xxD motif